MLTRVVCATAQLEHVYLPIYLDNRGFAALARRALLHLVPPEARNEYLDNPDGKPTVRACRPAHNHCPAACARPGGAAIAAQAAALLLLRGGGGRGGGGGGGGAGGGGGGAGGGRGRGGGAAPPPPPPPPMCAVAQAVLVQECGSAGPAGARLGRAPGAWAPTGASDAVNTAGRRQCAAGEGEHGRASAHDTQQCRAAPLRDCAPGRHCGLLPRRALIIYYSADR